MDIIIIPIVATYLFLGGMWAKENMEKEEPVYAFRKAANHAELNIERRDHCDPDADGKKGQRKKRPFLPASEVARFYDAMEAAYPKLKKVQKDIVAPILYKRAFFMEKGCGDFRELVKAIEALTKIHWTEW